MGFVRFIGIFLCIILMHLQVNAQLVAAFTPSITSGCYPLSVTFTNNSTGASSYSWAFGNGGSSFQASPTYTYYGTGTFTVTLSAMNGSNTSTQTAIITVVSSGTPTVSIVAGPGSAICAGTLDTFTASTFLPGTAPSYQWKKNGANVGLNSNIYLDNTLAAGDSIRCELTSNATCASTTYASSNTINMSITSNVTPTLSISTPNSTICAGITASFSSSTNISGAIYQWQLNNNNVGTNSSTYTYAPSNGDQIKCTVSIPGTGCYITNTATSNVINMLVNPTVVPSLTISTPNNSICPNSSAAFTATTNITNASFLWKVNGTNAGFNNSALSYNPTNGDVIKCIITVPAGTCATANTDTSNAISMTVNTAATAPTVTISTPKDTICIGDTSTFTLSSNVTGLACQWQVNSNNVGINSTTYTYVPAGSNPVRCIVQMPPNGCFTQNADTSNTIGMMVNYYLNSSISIATTQSNLCIGDTAHFTSNTNGINYQWRVNGVHVGLDSNIFSYIPSNNDTVDCIVNTPPGCYTRVADTSNKKVLTVANYAHIQITLSGPDSAMFNSTIQISITTNPANSGGFNSYWFKNDSLFDTKYGPGTGAEDLTKKHGTDTFMVVLLPNHPLPISGYCYRSDTSNILLVVEGQKHTGINSIGNENTITIYPNPASDHFTIKYSGTPAQNAKAELYNISGHLVYTGILKGNETTIYTNALAAGVYTCKIIAEGG